MMSSYSIHPRRYYLQDTPQMNREYSETLFGLLYRLFSGVLLPVIRFVISIVVCAAACVNVIYDSRINVGFDFG